ncbi:histidine--tRNA ligase [Mycoplasma sp. 4044]
MYQKVKGTKDIFGQEANLYLQIVDTFKNICQKYSFSYIETPVIEHTELFVRSAGEFSDIVNKEMYSFQTRGEKMISLRPEGTAPVIRSVVENKLATNNYYLKVFYYGNMYRYERPQKGRYREFRQGGVEFLAPKSVDTNFEIIKLASDFLNQINIKDFVLEINSLGSDASRKTYTQHLQKYFAKYQDKLSEINKKRLENNVLRILDDKEQNDLDFVKNAPQLWDFLSQHEKDDFNSLCKLLEKHNINYSVNKSLVRGLDYYNDIVFEFVSTSQALGTKSTILAGGRYDGMLKQLGGPDVDSIGFAFGMERLVEILTHNNSNKNYSQYKKVLVAYLNEDEKEEMTNLVSQLRSSNAKLSIEIFYEPLSIKKMFKKAEQIEADIIIFKELNQAKNHYKIKYVDKGKTLLSEKTIELKNIEQFIEEI